MRFRCSVCVSGSAKQHGGSVVITIALSRPGESPHCPENQAQSPENVNPEGSVAQARGPCTPSYLYCLIKGRPDGR